MMRGLIVILLFTLAAAIYAQIPPGKELALGQRMAADIESQYRPVTDPAVIGFVERLLSTLSRSESTRLPLKLHVMDDSELVAGLPGGFVILGSRAILRAGSEAELAGLLAHAIGHIQAGQFERPARSLGAQVPVIFLGCLRSNAGFPLALSSNRSELDLFESQADLLGLGYMVHAGYDPQALVTVFDRWPGTYAPGEEVKSRALALRQAVPNSIVNTSAFDNIKARLTPRRHVPTLYR